MFNCRGVGTAALACLFPSPANVVRSTTRAKPVAGTPVQQAGRGSFRALAESPHKSIFAWEHENAKLAVVDKVELRGSHRKIREGDFLPDNLVAVAVVGGDGRLARI